MDDTGPRLHFVATPPRQAAPMPKQTLIFWTPRLVLLGTLRSLRESSGPRQVVGRAVVRDDIR
jgi:hypothetical protein